MNNFIQSRIEKAQWGRFAIWFVLLFIFNYWAFYTSSPWATALEAAGVLPEMLPGFPADQPALAFSMLGDAAGSYIVWQIVDIPYAILNMLVFSTLIGLSLKRFRLHASPLQYLMLLPYIYLVTEFLENTPLALMAAGVLPQSDAIVLFQQTATTIKLYSGWPTLFISLIMLIALGAASLFSLIRPAKK